MKPTGVETSPTRRLVLHAALAAGMFGALLALFGAAFATFLGHPPSPLALVLIVIGIGLAFSLVARLVIARVASVRGVLGVAEPRRDERR